MNPYELVDDFAGISASSGTITIQAGVKIDSFTASPSTIATGESSTLSWSISNATSANINNGVGNVNASSGSTSVSPTQTTTYTLTASGASGTKTATATVTLSKVPKPVITYFTATPSTVVSGSPAKLKWAITGATSASISPGVGNVNKSSGEASVSPKSNTTYTLTATNSGGTATATTTVGVINEPEINWFLSSNDSDDPINNTEKAYLTWSVVGAETVTINNGVGSVNDEGGTIAVNPNNTTKYTLTATNAAGTSSEYATVAVTDKPRIRNFSAQPPAIILGQAVNFLWTAPGAASLNIDPGVGAVNGTKGVKGYFPEGSGTFTLTASNSAGSDSASANVRVVTDPAELELSLTKAGKNVKKVSAPSSGRRLGKTTAGTPIALECKLENLGVGDAEDFTVQLKENGEVIDEVFVDKIGPGGSETFEFDYTPVMPGNNNIEIVADGEGIIPEYDEANNEISGFFVAEKVDGIDLVISHVRIAQPDITAPASVLQVCFRLTNCGDEDAPAFQYRAYLTRKANRITAKDTLVIEGLIEGLEADGGYVEIKKLVIVKKVNKKFYFQGAVDFNNVVGEANESNNSVSKLKLRSEL